MEKLAVVAIAAVLTLSGCADRYPDYNYKMTVEVATPDGTKAFSSVREVTIEEKSTILDSTGKTLKYGLRGEAVIIDIPGRSPAFALLSKPNDGDYGWGVPEGAIRPQLTDEEEASADRDKIYYQRLAAAEGVYDLPKRVKNIAFKSGYYETWPMFVTFGDIDDPKTVREVSASQLGVRNITIEITDEDVTTGIEERLPSFGPKTDFKEWKQGLKYGDPRLAILGGLYRRDTE